MPASSPGVIALARVASSCSALFKAPYSGLHERV
jgi:hypothetical protein